MASDMQLSFEAEACRCLGSVRASCLIRAPSSLWEKVWSLGLDSFGYQSLELVAMRMDFKLGKTLSITAERDWPSPVHIDGLSISRGCGVLRSLVCSC